MSGAEADTYFRGYRNGRYKLIRDLREFLEVAESLRLPTIIGMLHDWEDELNAMSAGDTDRNRVAVEEALSHILSIANDLAWQDGVNGAESIMPYVGNALTIYQELLRGEDYERIDVRTLNLPTIVRLLEREH